MVGDNEIDINIVIYKNDLMRSDRRKPERIETGDHTEKMNEMMGLRTEGIGRLTQAQRIALKGLRLEL